MTIVGILGSPRPRGNTAQLLDAVLAGARAAGAEVERVDLAGIEANFCVACEVCYRTGRCQFDDDIELIKDKLLAADGIVLASPVYFYGVTAQMKTLIDRCGYLVHCQLLEGKYGAAVATAGGSGQVETNQWSAAILGNLGAQIVGTVAALAEHPRGLLDEAAALAQAKALGQDLAAAIAERRDYPEQAAGRQAIAEVMRQIVEAWGEDYSAQWAHWHGGGR